MVRKLVPADPTTFELKMKNNETYEGAWVSDPKGEHGEAVSENMIPVAGEAGAISMVPMLGVLWEKSKNPAIKYEDPTYLENIDHLYEDPDEEEEEEEEEETTANKA